MHKAVSTSAFGWTQMMNAWLIAGAGAIIIIISLAAALLPMIETARGATVVGGMMVLAGIIEMVAGTLRRGDRAWSMLPGAITAVAGSLFALGPFDSFVPMVWLVIAWLSAHESVRKTPEDSAFWDGSGGGT